MVIDLSNSESIEWFALHVGDEFLISFLESVCRTRADSYRSDNPLMCQFGIPPKDEVGIQTMTAYEDILRAVVAARGSIKGISRRERGGAP